MSIVVCRARIVQSCLHGRPEEAVYPESKTQSEDGTWNGRSVICNSCYVALLPYTPDGMGLLADLPRAIQLYKDARLPVEDRVEKFIRINESEDGVKVLREDVGDGSVKLHVHKDGMPEAMALIASGRPIVWL